MMWKLPRLLGLCWELRQPWPARPPPRNSLSQTLPHVDLLSENRSNSKLEETEVQLFCILCSLIIHNCMWQPLALKRRALSKSSFFCVALISGSPAASNIRCYWQDPALSPSIFHRRSEKKMTEKSPLYWAFKWTWELPYKWENCCRNPHLSR